MTTPRDPEPIDAARQAAGEFVDDQKRRARDLLLDWAPREVLGLALAALGVSAASIIGALPILAIVGVVLLSVAAVVSVVFARRLLHGERARRRWAEVAALRAKQDALRLQEAIDVVTLVLCGDRSARQDLHRIRQPELAQALRVVQHQSAQARADERPQPRGHRIRQPAQPTPPDLKAIAARRRAGAKELEAAEARIQALADPTDDAGAALADELREDAKGARKAALDATKLARDRRRRGVRATMRAGSANALDVKVGPEGVRDVQQRAVRSPEELADETPED